MTVFSPPSPEQLQSHLDHYAPQPPSPWTARLPLILLVAAVGMMLFLSGPLALVLPWLALGGIFVFLAIQMRRARSLMQHANRAHELAMLRRYSQAIRASWQLVPRLRMNPELYLRNVALLAHCLDRVKAYDAAIVGYDAILQHLPDKHPGGIQMQLSRAIAALCTERLADADDALRRLRSLIEPYANTPISAGYKFAQLLQQVRTHHYSDGIAGAGSLLNDLRPLGVEAGYGHALLALCYHHQRDADDDTHRQQAADLWWRRATALLPAPAIVHRFPEAKELVSTA